MFKNILNRHNIAIVLLALFMTLAYILGWSRLSVDLNKWPKILGVLPFLSVAFFGICWAIYKAQEKLQDDLKSKEIVQKKMVC